MPGSAFTEGQLLILARWEDEYKGAKGEARRNIVREVSAELGKLSGKRDRAQKEAQEKQINTWFSNRNRGRHASRPFRFAKQPRYNFRSVLVYENHEKVERTVIALSGGAQPGSTQYMSFFQRGVTKVADDLERQSPGILDQYKKISHDWNTGQPPSELQKRFAETDAIKAIHAFQDMLLRHANMATMVVTMCAGEDQRGTIALHDAPAKEGKLAYKTKHKNWPETPWWRTIESYTEYYHDLELDHNEDYERGIKRKRVPVELDLDEDGSPILDWDPAKPGPVVVQQEILRSFMNLTYAKKCGIPGTSVPWRAMIQDPASFISEKYLPKHFIFDHDPSKMRGEQVTRLLKHFKMRQEKRKIVLDFLDGASAGRSFTGRGSSHKPSQRASTLPQRNSGARHVEDISLTLGDAIDDADDIPVENEGHKRYQIQEINGQEMRREQSSAEDEHESDDWQSVDGHGNDADADRESEEREDSEYKNKGEREWENHSHGGRSGFEERQQISSSAYDDLFSPPHRSHKRHAHRRVESPAEDPESSDEEGSPRVDNPIELHQMPYEGRNSLVDFTHAHGDTFQEARLLQGGLIMNGKGKQREKRLPPLSRPPFVKEDLQEYSIHRGSRMESHPSDNAVFDAFSRHTADVLPFNYRSPMWYSTSAEDRSLFVIDMSTLQSVAISARLWRTLNADQPIYETEIPGLPKWLHWNSAQMFLPPDAHTVQGSYELLNWIAKYPYMDMERLHWKGRHITEMYLLVLAWTSRDLTWVLQAQKMSPVSEIYCALPRHIISSCWNHHFVEVLEWASNALTTLAIAMEPSTVSDIPLRNQYGGYAIPTDARNQLLELELELDDPGQPVQYQREDISSGSGSSKSANGTLRPMKGSDAQDSSRLSLGENSNSSMPQELPETSGPISCPDTATQLAVGKRKRNRPLSSLDISENVSDLPTSKKPRTLRQKLNSLSVESGAADGMSLPSSRPIEASQLRRSTRQRRPVTRLYD